MSNVYIVAEKTKMGYRGTIVLNGEKRWSREAKDPITLNRMLQACYPNIDYILTDDGVQDTGCLTMAECIECVTSSW